MKKIWLRKADNCWPIVIGVFGLTMNSCACQPLAIPERYQIGDEIDDGDRTWTVVQPVEVEVRFVRSYSIGDDHEVTSAICHKLPGPLLVYGRLEGLCGTVRDEESFIISEHRGRPTFLTSVCPSRYYESFHTFTYSDPGALGFTSDYIISVFQLIDFSGNDQDE